MKNDRLPVKFFTGSIGFMHLPGATITRLCQLYDYLTATQKHTMSSREIGCELGIGSDTIRKDISILTEYCGSKENLSKRGSKGYDIATLKELICSALGFKNKHRACIIGLGKLGTSLLEYYNKNGGDYELIAGFDSNQNKIELMKESIPLYPAYDIPEICEERNIEIAFITVPEDSVDQTVARALKGGIKGFLNFTPKTLNVPEGIFVQNISFAREYRILTAMMK